MRKLITRIGMAVIACAAALLAPGAGRPVSAAWVTVQGTVEKETSAELLYLKTAQGVMQIKIDPATDLTKCHILLPGQSVTAGINMGSDGFLHAESLSGETAAGPVTVNRQNPVTVDGTVAQGTTADMLVLSTSGGTMQVKLDHDSDMSGAGVLVLGRKIRVTLGYGSDAYLHVLKVSPEAVAVAVQTIPQVPGAAVNVNTVQVAGVLQNGTTGGTLILKTIGGTMELKLDGTTDLTGCKLLVPNRSVTAYVYHGNDAYLHAARVAPSGSLPAATSPAVAATVRGKVMSGTTADTLYLSTTGGNMTIRIDGGTNMDNVGAVYIGSTVTVQVGFGTDSYLHAVSVTS